MKKWTDSSPRAFAPTLEMLIADEPISPTIEQAHKSPLPYGIGVYCEGNDGKLLAQNLYWVSERAAFARGRGVGPGWYVSMNPGIEFKLVLTKVQETEKSFIYGTQVGEGRIAAARVEVDGMKVAGGRYLLDLKPHKNKWLHGLVVSRRKVGEELVRESVPFCFKLAIMDDKTSTAPLTCSTSLIRLCVYQGVRENNELEYLDETISLPPAKTIHEQTALKQGKSLQLDRSKNSISSKDTRLFYTFVPDEADHLVNVHVREHFWLESRKIIDANGSLWKREKIIDVIDIECNERDQLKKRELSLAAIDRIEIKKVKK